MINESICIELVQDIAKKATARKVKIAVAESCTGGWLAKIITDIPGSSDWFNGGFVCYSNQFKQQCLRVNDHSLKQFGAVSETVAQQLCSSLNSIYLADIGCAITGVAGPDTSISNNIKPVGLVCFAWSNKHGYMYSDSTHFQGDRYHIRLQSVYYALSGIQQLLS